MSREQPRVVRALPGLPAVGPREDLDVVPLPQVHLSLIRPVPGPVVRLLPGFTLLLCAAMVARSTPLWLLALTAAALMTWRPHLPVASAVAVFLGIWVFAQQDLLAATAAAGGQGGLLLMAALVLFVHLLLRLTALAAQVSWQSVVEGAVLGRVARSVLGAQLVAQSLVLAVVWLRSGVGGAVAGQGWLRLVAVVAAVAVAVLVMPRQLLVRRSSE